MFHTYRNQDDIDLPCVTHKATIETNKNIETISKFSNRWAVIDAALRLRTKGEVKISTQKINIVTLSTKTIFFASILFQGFKLELSCFAQKHFIVAKVGILTVLEFENELGLAYLGCSTVSTYTHFSDSEICHFSQSSSPPFVILEDRWFQKIGN